MVHLSTGWQPEHSDALCEYVAAGLSYAKAADKINASFGTAYSRNAAIGRANRLGLACPERPALGSKERKPREHKPRIRIVASNGNSNRQRVIQVSETDQFVCRAVDVVPRNLTLMELEPGDCRYPYGDSDYRFCGHAALEGSSYCHPHFNLTRKPHVNISDERREQMRIRGHNLGVETNKKKAEFFAQFGLAGA